MANIVYIATSLDGYIATPEGSVDWLNEIPNPENSDFGFSDFIKRVDCILMGRGTYETVAGFGGDWPYQKKVYVLSQTLRKVPGHLCGKVELVRGPLSEVLTSLSGQGLEHIYVDGGKLIQSFLREDLIDEMIITRVPILLGAGIPLFGELVEPMKWRHQKSEVLAGALVKSSYQRER